MEDDRRVTVWAGQDEATVIYLDSIVRVLIERYGFETADDLSAEVTQDYTSRAASYEWTAELRAQLAALDSAVLQLLEHHKPIEKTS